MKSHLALLAISLVVLSGGLVYGDVVYMNDGGRHEGVVRKEDGVVFIETAEGTVEVRAEDVIYISLVAPPVADEEQSANENTLDGADSDSTPTSDGQGEDEPARTLTAHAKYFVIPIYGTIGTESQVDTLVKCFNVAAIQKASVIILHIDSGGGFIGAKDEILDLLREKKKEFRIVAYVTEAGSAAAMIALICDEIVVEPEATIGSCVPYFPRPPGTPVAVDAKFTAFETAKLRATAEEGGHDPLLAQAMIDYDMLLSYNTTDHGIELVSGGGQKVIKASQAILNLTAEEAVAYGLAIGKSAELVDIKDHIAIQSWKATSQRGLIIQAQWKQELADASERLDNLMEEMSDKWEDVDAAYDAKKYRRAFRLINALQTCVRKIRGITIKYEGKMTLNGALISEEHQEYYEERLKDLADSEEEIEAELKAPGSKSKPVWQTMTPPGAG